MADPISIFASVLATATAVIQFSKAIFEVTNGIKTASKEIQAISRDALSLHSTISALYPILRKGELGTKDAKDVTILEMARSLEAPLLDCKAVLKELDDKLQKKLKPKTKGSRDWTGAASVKWVLYVKNEVKDLQVRLEAAKSTLNTALSGVAVGCGLHLITMDKIQMALLTNITSRPFDTGFAIRRFIGTNANMELEPSQLPEIVDGLSHFEQEMANRNETARLRAHPLDLDCQSSSQDTQDGIRSGDDLSQSLVKVYQELAVNKMLLKEIHETIVLQGREDNGHVVLTVSQSHTLEDDKAPSDSGTCFAEALNHHQSELFSDCASRSSKDEFYSTCDEWSSALDHPSPANYMEGSSTVYPERLTIEGFFKDPLFLIAQKRSRVCYWTQEYFLLYAETPRRWRRLTISATFEGLRDRLSIFGADEPHDSEQTRMTLPSIIWDHLNGQLPHLDRFAPVTNFSLAFRQNENGSVVHDDTRTRISEDRMEVYSSGEDKILHDIEDLECEQYLESDVITQTRKRSSCFVVLVESRVCIERKAPFVNSGVAGGNGFKNYFADLKFLKSLHGCRGVAQFMGVVLNDARSQLKSYLYEYPALGDLRTILVGAQSRSKIIPWNIRESWARQLVKTVAEIHRDRGALVGGLWWLVEIGVRANGTLALTALRTSQRHWDERPGMMAPELRGIPLSEKSTLEKMTTFRTEIFQLGLLLWMIAEHKDNTCGSFCPRHACTIRPQYTCTLEHANPIKLPTCSAGVPPYFNEIVKQCRFSDPKDRKTASQLEKMFPPAKKDIDDIPPEIMEMLKRCAVPDTFHVCCHECGTRDMNVNYHCNQCQEGRFDLCEGCYSERIPCLDKQHRLIKRILTEQGAFKVVPE